MDYSIIDYPDISVYIDGHAFQTTSVVAENFSNSIRNSRKLDKTMKKFEFSAFVKTELTYKLLETVMKGEKISYLSITNEIAGDLFNVGYYVGNLELIRVGLHVLQLHVYSVERICQLIRLSKQIEFGEDMIDFIVQNIDKIERKDLISSLNSVGYDFCEHLIQKMKEQKSPVNWVLESLISNDESLIGLYKYIDTYLEFSQCLRIMKQIVCNQRIAENYDENLYELYQNILFPALEKFSIENDESQQLSSDLLEQYDWMIEAQEEERVILSKDLLELEEKYNKNIDEQILNKSIWRNKGSILSRSLLASVLQILLVHYILDFMKSFDHNSMLLVVFLVSVVSVALATLPIDYFQFLGFVFKRQKKVAMEPMTRKYILE